MAQTQVTAALVKKVSLRRPDGRPNVALLALQAKGGTPQYFALTRDSLLKMAEAMRKHAESMPQGDTTARA